MTPNLMESMFDCTRRIREVEGLSLVAVPLNAKISVHAHALVLVLDLDLVPETVTRKTIGIRIVTIRKRMRGKVVMMRKKIVPRRKMMETIRMRNVVEEMNNWYMASCVTASDV
mmetsp:Transcript_3206/g.3985  ORF Transcript_3206/g.3985 Transcript_3206/m.3985 type:complete len:114 (-) Transcript_3206:74-415(-)